MKGEKIVPIQQQDIVSAHPLVKGNIMFGRGREQVGILIEPRPDHTIIPGHDHVLAEFRNMLWYPNSVLPLLSLMYMFVQASDRRSESNRTRTCAHLQGDDSGD